MKIPISTPISFSELNRQKLLLYRFIYEEEYRFTFQELESFTALKMFIEQFQEDSVASGLFSRKEVYG